MVYKFCVRAFLLIAVLTGSFTAGFSQSSYSKPGRGDRPLRERLSERIPGWMEKYDIPGLVLAGIEDGAPAWQEAYGYADLAEGRPMTVNTVCRVESISKSVTAWGVMKLVEEGEIALDSPVMNYLKSWSFPESPYPEEQITVRQLLSHSSGLPLGTIGERFAPQGPTPSLKERLTKDALLQNKPGAVFSYSNAGFNVLELMVEEVTGRDFAGYMEQEVLRPLGMEHASFEWHRNFPTSVPNGYDQKGSPIPVYVYPDRASGGLFATAGDVARFVAAGMPAFSQKGLKVLRRESIDLMYTFQIKPGGFYGLAFDGYGLGYFIEHLPSGEKAVAHGGQGSGWMTHFHVVPETGDGIVILTNSQRSWPFFSLLLSEWAEACGFPGIGMGIIKRANTGIWVAIGLCALFILPALWKGCRGLFTGRRMFAPLSRLNRPVRLLQGVFFLLLLYLLIWALSQPYLFLTSIFPISSKWLGVCMTGIMVSLFFYILFPQTKPEPDHVAD